ncbi:MAG: pantoate--beta-alanine ligase [Bacteroidetes bacterium]|nr:pantoate--beta-alanine ligase [Bacteroidota bacterium]
MLEFDKLVNIHEWCSDRRKEGLSIGFVPTMGALHQGHMSLIKIARKNCDIVISSIFVNPTQFNVASDYEKYPITIEEDSLMLKEEGCDAVFIPPVLEIYPESDTYDLDVDLGYIGECMEASKRPGHFEGVMQVVKRLLEIVTPDVLYLGRKDYQQFRVVGKMVETYNLPVKVEQCPIVREDDGLAMSSRNRRLSPEARQAATSLSMSLAAIVDGWQQHDPHHLTQKYTQKLNEHHLIDVEYLDIVDNETLRPINDWNETENAIVCVAAYVGGIRLIDNATIY